MNDKQRYVVELLTKLGSQGNVKNASDGTIYVGSPFHPDRDPNIKVWTDGSWHDFSADKGWNKFGMKWFGTMAQLELIVKRRFSMELAEMKKIEGEALAYAEKRKLETKDVRMTVDNGRTAMAFPIYTSNPSSSDVVGIQLRYIDGQTPKNKMLHGSNGRDGVFYSEGLGNVIVICEGVTDTYTKDDRAHVGAPSCSMLKGVKEFISLHRDMEYIIAFDGDEPGRNAQAEAVAYCRSLGIENIYELYHSSDCKDLNDEIVKHGEYSFNKIDAASVDTFVTMVDTVPHDAENYVWVSFFPKDFPNYKHEAVFPNYKNSFYVFPESYGRAKVNQLMVMYNSSAYILRGW